MTPKEMAQELVYDIQMELPHRVGFDTAKTCALVAVTYIIRANPHSNPLNTSAHSTMSYWQEVKMEIKNLNN
jgi:hypothetical protein